MSRISDGMVFRAATQAQIAAFARHQWLLDRGIDIGLYGVIGTQGAVKSLEFR